MRGLVRLKSVVNSAAVKRQTTNTLQTMQGVSRVQYQINSRRIRMSEENQVLQKQLLRKRAKQLESLQVIKQKWALNFSMWLTTTDFYKSFLGLPFIVLFSSSISFNRISCILMLHRWRGNGIAAHNQKNKSKQSC